MFYPEVLNRNQLEIIKKLLLPDKFGFYLAGDTALALQVGHRTSIDFDFYSQKHFDNNKLIDIFRQFFSRLEIIFQEEDTLKVTIDRTELSFFYYRYQLIEKLRKYHHFQIASTKDIAAMKIAAIVQRGTRRDFIDIYYLLKRYSLNKIINFTIKKYPGYQEMLVLRALIYFKDADEERFKRAIEVLDPDYSWNKVKKKIFAEVKKYQMEMIK